MGLTPCNQETPVPSLWLALVLTSLPALAAGAGGGETAKGSGSGVLLAFVLGILAGGVLVAHAYRRAPFGEEPAHQEEAHDYREGFADEARPSS